MNFYDDGSKRLTRINEGFNPYELLGLSFKSQNGNIRPNQW